MIINRFLIKCMTVDVTKQSTIKLSALIIEQFRQLIMDHFRQLINMHRMRSMSNLPQTLILAKW